MNYNRKKLYDYAVGTRVKLITSDQSDIVVWGRIEEDLSLERYIHCDDDVAYYPDNADIVEC